MTTIMIDSNEQTCGKCKYNSISDNLLIQNSLCKLFGDLYLKDNKRCLACLKMCKTVKTLDGDILNDE